MILNHFQKNKNLKGREILDNFDDKRGKELLEHLDIIRFTKEDVSKEIESTKGEIGIKKTGNDLETSGGLRTNA